MAALQSEEMMQKLSHIDNRTKYAVFGWLRRAEIALHIAKVPHMIALICIMYYHQDDLFEIIGHNIKAALNRKCITLMEPNRRKWYNNSYGINQIESTRKVAIRWDLKMRKLKDNDCMVGLSSMPETKRYFSQAKGYHFVFWGCGFKYDPMKNGSHWQRYGRRIKQNDIVSILLDLRNDLISFSVNGKSQGVAYQGMEIKKDKEVKYRLLVSLYDVDDVVEIVNFSSY